MKPFDASVPELVRARRSIRAFGPEPVTKQALSTMVEAACLAPAPHHSRPWRWVTVTTADTKLALARGMGERWRVDLRGDGIDERTIDEMVTRSHTKIIAAPAIIIGCLTWSGLDRYPDVERQRAEWGMGLLSLGAAVENLMLTATQLGYASCWVAAPIFCPAEARDALELEPDWLPHAMVIVGHADDGYFARERPPVILDELHRAR